MSGFRYNFNDSSLYVKGLSNEYVMKNGVVYKNGKPTNMTPNELLDELTKVFKLRSQHASNFASDTNTWDAEVDPELMKVVPTINKFLIDEATRISDETGRKVYPKDIIDAVLKSIEPESGSRI